MKDIYKYPEDGNPIFDEELSVSYDKGKTWEDGIWYSERRTCMLAGVAGGCGYFGEGFAVSGDSECDTNLIVDAPTHYKYLYL